jgi:hypothetical protein
METPQRKKVVISVVAERLKEARASALKQLLFERGVAMESWIGCLLMTFIVIIQVVFSHSFQS